MCGINAVAGAAADLALIGAMNAALAHRGPDGEGVWHSPCGRVTLGHRRLAILDLSDRGRQPFANLRGTSTLVYNGEVYNFRELRTRLEQRGVRFRSATDTEVVLALYDELGQDALHELNGMFAFVLFDSERDELFAARDETGIKPLYYAPLAHGGLALSSELKALLVVPGVDRSLDLEAISDYLAYQFIPDPSTPFRGIHRVPPGHCLTWKRGEWTLRRWWEGHPPERGGSDATSLSESAEALRGALLRAVDRQLVSDRPVGAFLSGGLDSSAVVAAMARAQGASNVRCYTIGYSAEDERLDPFDPDLPHARQVAQHLGVNLTSFEVRADLAATWPELVRALDEPMADPAAMNAFLIAQKAREDGTVVLLSGQGADEIFGGYRRHIAGRLLNAVDLLPGPMQRLLVGGAALIPGGRPGRTGAVLRRARKLLEAADGDFDERFLRLCAVAPEWALQRVLSPDLRERLNGYDMLTSGRALMAEVRRADPIDRMMYRDLKTYLPAQNLQYTDRATMASGVEARVPFLDDEVLNLALRMRPGHKLRGLSQTKVVLREAVRPWLPREVLTRPKTGFGVPLRGWIRGGLAPLVDDLLSADAIRRRGLLDPTEVERQRRAFECGEADYAYAIFTYLTLELWCQAYLDSPTARYDTPRTEVPLTSVSAVV